MSSLLVKQQKERNTFSYFSTVYFQYTIMVKKDSTNARNKKRLMHLCRINGALDMIAGRWKALIIIHISEGTNRFSLLKAALESISDQALGKQLKELEADKLITKKTIEAIPIKVEYTLTAKAEALLPILEQLSEWFEPTPKASRNK